MCKFLFFISISFLLIVLVSCAGHEYKEKFAYSPQNPEAGEIITVYYNPSGTILSDTEGIELVAYFYSSDLNDAVDVEMEKDGIGWKGQFTAPEGEYGVVLKFVKGDMEESNDKKGYWIDLYKSGKEIPGTMAAKANIYSRYAGYVGIDRDFEYSKELFAQAFTKFPESKEEEFDNYLFMLSRSKIDGYQEFIKAELGNLELKDKLSENELTILANWYPVIGDAVKGDVYKRRLLNEYPNGKFAENDLISKINQEPNIDKKIEMLHSFESKYPNSESINDLYNSIARSYSNVKLYSEAKTFLSDNFDSISPYTFYSIASKIDDEGGEKSLALELAKMGTIRSRQELEKPKEKKPKSMTVKEWQRERKYYLTLNLYKYCSLLYDGGKRDEILPILDEAINLSIDNYIPQSLIDLYSKVLVESRKYESALTRLGDFIKEGKGSADVTNALKEAYINKNGNEEGFENYIKQFEDAADVELNEKLKKEILNLPAPQFTLKDLNGKEVSLADYKGKTVILDFWATWCPPCKASFPGMKLAVEKYAKDENVKFLFIDTWERVTNKKQNAVDFIKQNKYPFHVLLDDDYKVVGSFKVSSIPTKFIIDGNGNIRFRSIGFSGNIEHLLREIDLMIKMLK